MIEILDASCAHLVKIAQTESIWPFVICLVCARVTEYILLMAATGLRSIKGMGLYPYRSPWVAFRLILSYAYMNKQYLIECVNLSLNQKHLPLGRIKYVASVCKTDACLGFSHG